MTMLGDIFNIHDLGVLPASSEARPRMFLNILFVQPVTHTQRICSPKVSVMLRWGNPALENPQWGFMGGSPTLGRLVHLLCPHPALLGDRLLQSRSVTKRTPCHPLPSPLLVVPYFAQQPQELTFSLWPRLSVPLVSFLWMELKEASDPCG